MEHYVLVDRHTSRDLRKRVTLGNVTFLARAFIAKSKT
jgi:hypothetical protein